MDVNSEVSTLKMLRTILPCTGKLWVRTAKFNQGFSL